MFKVKIFGLDLMSPQTTGNMRLLTTFLFALIATQVFAQIQLKKLNKSSIPKSIRYSGKIQDASSWHDSLGYHVVLLTETGMSDFKYEDEREASLYAYHYIMMDSGAKLTWRVYDYIKVCPFDVTAEFVKNSFAVTDLDRDGTTEIWVMYRLGCRSDISPNDQKIIMYEGAKKYAVRGNTRMPEDDRNFVGGEFTLDEAFIKGPASFRKFAEQHWKKYMTEKFE